MYYAYHAALVADEDDGGFIVSFRDIPEVLTQGDTEAEALDNAVDALDEAIAGYIIDGDALPKASRARKGEHLVAVPLQSVLKYFLRDAIVHTGITKVALADAIGVDEKEVRRMLDPHHNTRMRRLEKALSVIGRQPVIEIIETKMVA